MPLADPLHALIRAGTLDAELGGLVWLLLDARLPHVVVAEDEALAGPVADALEGLVPGDAAIARVQPDDDFVWLPQAPELGWRRERPAGAVHDAAGGAARGPGPEAEGQRLTPGSGVLVARRLASPGGIDGARARVVVRALALGYGLLATMHGRGLDDVLEALHGPEVGTDADERSRLGVVLAVADDAGTARVTAAHYVRPVALDAHGHVQRLPPAVLATWNAPTGRFDHFGWGVVPDLAGRLGVRPVDFEREHARRASVLREAAGTH